MKHDFSDLLYLVGVIILPFTLAFFLVFRLMVKWLNETRKISVYKVLLAAGLALTALYFALITIDLVTIRQVNKQLGFRFSTPESKEGEFFVVTRVEKGKAMERWGLKARDTIQVKAVESFYKKLLSNQQGHVIVPVKRNGKLVLIKVRIPEMRLPLARMAFKL